MVHTITLQLPEEVYTQLKLASEAMQQSVEAITMQSVKMGLPLRGSAGASPSQNSGAQHVLDHYRILIFRFRKCSDGRTS